MSRKRGDEDEEGIHRGREVLDHYSKRSNVSRSERGKSRTFGVKSMNNWIKAVAVNRFGKKDAVVLDICGGKGGDMFKWERSGAAGVVLIDGADGSVRDALDRYQKSKSKLVTLFGVADCFVVRLDSVLPKDLVFDIVSCQFAAHYAWASQDLARRLFQNFSDRLVGGGLLVGTIPNKEELVKRLQAAPGNTFGNALYSVTFPREFEKKTFPEFGCSYSFFLDDAVTECEEYLVSKESFERLANEVGLDLVEWTPFEEFKTTHKPQFVDLFNKMKAGLAEDSKNDWDVVTLYASFVFRKRGEDNCPRVPLTKLGIQSNKVIFYK